MVHYPAHIAGTDVLGDDPPDIPERPTGERPLLIALGDGLGYQILHLVCRLQMLPLQLAEESLYQFEVGIWILHDPTVDGEELLDRGELFQQGLNLLHRSAEPEKVIRL